MTLFKDFEKEMNSNNNNNNASVTIPQNSLILNNNIVNADYYSNNEFKFKNMKKKFLIPKNFGKPLKTFSSFEKIDKNKILSKEFLINNELEKQLTKEFKQKLTINLSPKLKNSNCLTNNIYKTPKIKKKLNFQIQKLKKMNSSNLKNKKIKSLNIKSYTNKNTNKDCWINFHLTDSQKKIFNDMFN